MSIYDLIDMTAGVFGGIVVVIVGHPFDTTKTRLQTAPNGFYSGTMDCIRKTLKWEGARGFYSGIQSPLAGQMFYRAFSFGGFYHFSRYFTELHNHAVASERDLLLAGALTGFLVSVIESPIDLLKTKLQVQVFQSRINPGAVPHYTTMFQCLTHTLSSNGCRGLFQGLSGTIIRNVPANALFFPVNEMIKRSLATREGIEIEDLSFGQTMVAGAGAGLCYWVGTYPLDVVKARMQSVPFEQRVGWLEAARSVVRLGGWRAFGQGLIPCAARSIPACSSMFATVDFVRRYLNDIVES